MKLRFAAGAALLMLAGCATGPNRPAPAVAGPPEFPATFSLADPSTPSLPEHGPVGRGALMYASPRTGFALVLLLADGHQFRLPPTPAGEGRQGSLYASLSPDGRWLGRRVAEYAGDPRYVFRELTGTRVIETTGHPVLWSPDSRSVVMTPDDTAIEGLTSVSLATGAVSPMATGLFQDGLWLAGLLPDGRTLYSGGPSGSLRLRAGGTDRTVVFATGAENECWCPRPGLHLSPDGRTASVQLAHDDGLVPGTGIKASPQPAGSVMIAVIDVSSGTVRHRVEPTAAEPTGSWQLLADTGSGLLLERFGADGVSLVLLDPATGAQRMVTRLPDGASIVAPGQLEPPHDG